MAKFELEGRVPLVAIMPRGYGPSRSLEPPSGEPIPAVPYSPGVDINSLPESSARGSSQAEGQAILEPAGPIPGPTEGYPPIPQANLEAIAEAIQKQTVIWMDRGLAMVEGEEFELLDEELGALGYTLLKAYERYLEDRTRGIRMRFGVQSVRSEASLSTLPDVPVLPGAEHQEMPAVEGSPSGSVQALRKATKKRRNKVRSVHSHEAGEATPPSPARSGLSHPDAGLGSRIGE